MYQIIDRILDDYYLGPIIMFLILFFGIAAILTFVTVATSPKGYYNNQQTTTTLTITETR